MRLPIWQRSSESLELRFQTTFDFLSAQFPAQTFRIFLALGAAGFGEVGVEGRPFPPAARFVEFGREFVRRPGRFAAVQLDLRLRRMATRLQDVEQIEGAGGEQGQGFGVGVQGLATGELVGNGAGIGQDTAQKTADCRTQSERTAERGDVQPQADECAGCRARAGTDAVLLEQLAVEWILMEGFGYPVAAVDFAVVEAVEGKQPLLHLSFDLADFCLHGLQDGRGVVVFVDFLREGCHIEQETCDFVPRFFVQTRPFAAAGSGQTVDDVVLRQHGGELVPKVQFAFKIKCDGIEPCENVEITTRQHGCPRLGKLSAGKVEHGHDRFGAP